MTQQKLDVWAFAAPLVLMGFGGLSLYLGLPDDGPVTCGSSTMYPGDYCGPLAGRVITGSGGPPASNYDAIAAEQHASTPFAIILGVVLLVAGAAVLALLVHAARRRPAQGQTF
ncbi:hypothetical protein [Kitasatospora sp. NPDC088351]|uniref:hypothetical protein n=1 Tax=unclassified Kitasatospora TaxID=2633591 RepID=UPI0034386800